MRLGGKIVLCAAAMTALFLGSALAAENYTDGVTTDRENCSMTYDSDSGKYAVSYTGSDLEENGQYVLLVVKGTKASYSVGADTIVYIDQTAAREGSVTFDTVVLGGAPDCVVLLGGTFNETKSPIVLATLESQGVTVSGKVTSYDPQNPVTLELYKTGTTENPAFTGTIPAQTSGSGQVTQGFTIGGVSAGTYDLKVTKANHAVYWLTGIPVGDTDLEIGDTIVLPCGDVNGDSYIDVRDVNSILSKDTYNKTTDETANPEADLNGDTYVDVRDVNTVLSKDNYNKSTVTKAYAQ